MAEGGAERIGMEMVGGNTSKLKKTVRHWKKCVQSTLAGFNWEYLGMISDLGLIHGPQRKEAYKDLSIKSIIDW